MGLSDGEFQPFGRVGKQEEDDELPQHFDFDYSDDADVEKKEKVVAFTKDLTFDSGRISDESKKVWRLAQKESGLVNEEEMMEDEEEEEEEDEELSSLLHRADSKERGVVPKEGEKAEKGKKGKRKRADSEDTSHLLQPKKKVTHIDLFLFVIILIIIILVIFLFCY